MDENKINEICSFIKANKELMEDIYYGDDWRWEAALKRIKSAIPDIPNNGYLYEAIHRCEPVEDKLFYNKWR